MTFITSDEQIARVVKKALKEKEREEANPERLYTIAQAARLLGKTYQTVCRMVKQNRITTTSDGRYISQRAIDFYLGL